jgi:hypothetical protein
MQIDDALAEVRLAGDGRDGRVGEAVLGDAADRGLDELLAALFRGRRASARQRGQRPFGVQANPVESTSYENFGRHRGIILPGFALHSMNE